MFRAALLLALAACSRTGAPAEAPPERPCLTPSLVQAAPVAASPVATAPAAPPPWLKGSTHVHTLYSGDGDTPVADVVAWYAAARYDFIVVTDHNRVTTVEGGGPMLVLPGIEMTHNPASCDPPPPEPDGKCRIHVNALVVDRFPITATGVRPEPIEWAERTSIARTAQYQAAIDRGCAMGGVVQLNHPRWHWGVDGALLAELGRRGVALVEIANAAFQAWDDGEPGRQPSSEATWDAALTAGATVWAVASDDAHHYGARPTSGPYYPPGGGFVMVRAERRPDAIRAALARGEFYASTGVYLERAGLEGTSYRIEVAAASAGDHHFTVIGTGGTVLAERDGRSLAFDLATAPAGYLRVVVRDPAGKQAWTQPVRVGAPAGTSGTR